MNENMKTIKGCHRASFWHHVCLDGLVEIQDLGRLEGWTFEGFKFVSLEIPHLGPLDGHRKPYFHRQLKDTILQPLDN